MPVGLSDLTETEQDLLSHLQNGYQLETDSLGQEPMLRHTEDNQVMRSLSATRNTVKALEERGLICGSKGADRLNVVWLLSENKPRKKSRT